MVRPRVRQHCLAAWRPSRSLVRAVCEGSDSPPTDDGTQKGHGGGGTGHGAASVGAQQPSQRADVDGVG